jgi:hypothetical protein
MDKEIAARSFPLLAIITSDPFIVSVRWCHDSTSPASRFASSTFVVSFAAPPPLPSFLLDELSVSLCFSYALDIFTLPASIAVQGDRLKRRKTNVVAEKQIRIASTRVSNGLSRPSTHLLAGLVTD